MKKAFLVLLTGILLISLFSCRTYRDYNISKDIVVEENIGDVHLKLEYLTEDQVRSEVKGKVNPFVDVLDLLGKRIVIFKLTAESQETFLNIAYTDIFIQINREKGLDADNRFVFLSNYRGSRNYYDIEAVVNRYVLPDVIKIEPGKVTQGYIVFVDWFPKVLESAVFMIPAETSDGQAGIIKMEIPVDKIEEYLLEQTGLKDSSEDPDSIFFDPDKEKEEDSGKSAE